MNVNSLPSFTPPCGSFASNTWRYTNSFSLIYRLNGTYISQRPVEHSLWHQQWSSNCPVIMPTNNTKNHLATFYTPSYLTSHCKPTSSCRGHGDWGPRTSAVLASRILHHCIVILEKPLWMFILKTYISASSPHGINRFWKNPNVWRVSVIFIYVVQIKQINTAVQ